MTYTKKQFIEDVKKEAVALKKNATKEELAKLDIDQFDPSDEHHCVYGLVTGFCRSDRAVELIEKCCPRFIKGSALWNIVREIDRGKTKAFSVVPEHVNGAKWEGEKDLHYVSTIEAYIYLPESKNKNLIDFLKGNRKDLVL